MANDEILKTYKEEIDTQLHEQFPDFYIVVFEDLEEGFELPAIAINQPIIEPLDLTMQKTPRLKTTLTSSAFVIYSAADSDNEIDCIQQAVNLAKFINMKTFGQKTPLLVTLVEPVKEEGLEEFCIYRIEFEQKFEI